MSSYIKKTSSDFFVPTEHTGKVLAAGLRFLPDALFCFPMDREGNIVDVKVEGCILSEMREMLAAIAPWVREGSYLSLCSDDGSRSDFLLVADSGPGERDAKGLIVPRFGKKPENHVALSMTMESFCELLLLTRAHYQAWLSAGYARGDVSPQEDEIPSVGEAAEKTLF